MFTSVTEPIRPSPEVSVCPLPQHQASGHGIDAAGVCGAVRMMAMNLWPPSTIGGGPRWRDRWYRRRRAVHHGPIPNTTRHRMYRSRTCGTTRVDGGEGVVADDSGGCTGAVFAGVAVTQFPRTPPIPQHHAWPAVSRAQVCQAPASMSAKEWLPTTGVGVPWRDRVFPGRRGAPFEPLPQHHAWPAVSIAQVCQAPASMVVKEWLPTTRAGVTVLWRLVSPSPSYRRSCQFPSTRPRGQYRSRTPSSRRSCDGERMVAPVTRLGCASLVVAIQLAGGPAQPDPQHQALPEVSSAQVCRSAVVTNGREGVPANHAIRTRPRRRGSAVAVTERAYCRTPSTRLCRMCPAHRCGIARC